MKLTIIGAGNMGGAVARGLVGSGFLAEHRVTVVDHNAGVRDAFAELGVDAFADLGHHDAVCACRDADVVMLAVKPWYVAGVVAELLPVLNDRPNVVLASVAAGVTVSDFQEMGVRNPVVRVMPNTAVSVRESMTFVVGDSQVSELQVGLVCDIFALLGEVRLLKAEAELEAAMHLASCGIAYALRYVRAAVQGGVELGMSEPLARQAVAQTLIGAATLLLKSGNHPEVEIDRVTTPGGITIKGLNAMEAAGFSSAVVAGLVGNRL